MTRTKPTDRALLPKGMATLLPADAAVRRRLERSAFDVFRSWGYEEIITPLFEYLDVITPGLGPGLVDKTYTVADRSTGRLMVLRPDVTPQIARMAATVLRDAPKPLRLCYGANVFRYEDEHAGHEREIFQLGAEYIGPSDPSADAEVLAVAVDLLGRFGVKGATAVVGHVGFFLGWLAEADLSPDRAHDLEEAVAKKDRSAVIALLVAGGRSRAAAIRLAGLLDLIGASDVLDRAAAVVDNPPARHAIASLRDIALQAREYGIADALVFDLAEIRGREYYSGLIFDLFADGVGYEIGRGGRYDELIGRFGAPTPSTGFAIHVERLQQSLGRTADRPAPSAIDALVVASDGARGAIRLAGRLRRAGLRVALWTATDGEPLAYAKRSGIPWLLAPGPSGDRVAMTATTTNRIKRVAVRACLAALAAPRGQRRGGRPAARKGTR
ncbi:MAG: ATP phosphoribosyltransferase regulatory subunit [Nitrospirota bacterium]